MSKNAIDDFTDPRVLTVGVAAGWADAETDPTTIDWSERLGRALIPFRVVAGRPVRPDLEQTTLPGRGGLGLWGENAMADALVELHHQGRRHVLLVERGDGLGWAIPGGKIERGEHFLAAAIRELQEETTLQVPGHLWRPGRPRLVDDPRAQGRQEAWAVTVVSRADLGVVEELPYVEGQDDADAAGWIPADTYEDLVEALAGRGGRVFSAHTEMLCEALEVNHQGARPAHEVVPQPETSAGERSLWHAARAWALLQAVDPSRGPVLTREREGDWRARGLDEAELMLTWGALEEWRGVHVVTDVLAEVETFPETIERYVLRRLRMAGIDPAAILPAGTDQTGRWAA